MGDMQIVWSGQACPFRRAGVYYGLSPVGAHEQVARWLLPRRGAVYTHGRLMVRPESGAVAPLTYFAVRDPSAVRVVPVRRSRAAPKGPLDDFTHVSLVFTPDRRAGASPGPEERELAHLSHLARESSEMDHGGFIVTIGLRTDREAEFHERVILGGGVPTYPQLCDRIMALRDEFST